MAPRKGSRWPFTRPGRATLWGLIAIPATGVAAAMHSGLAGYVAVAVVTALAGCYDPGN